MSGPINVLHHINEMKQIWKNQDFRFTKEQKQEYELLLSARHERVKWFYENDLVFKGPRIVKEKEKPQEEE